MITFKGLYQSARLRSLPLSMSGIILGSGIAYGQDIFRWDIFLLALLTTMLFQILSDYANDYGDAQKGTDNEQRLGPIRAIQSGEITLSEMKKIVIITALLSAISAIVLIITAFGANSWYVLLFALLGALAIFSAIRYTVGKSAYGYKGLGDLFVFIFFGLVSVAGSYFLYAESLEWKIFLPAIACGMLSMGVLNLNNMRDIVNDKQMGKHTIPVKIGFDFAKYYHYFLILLPMLLMMLYSLLNFEFGKQNLYLFAFIPLIFHLFFVKKTTEPQKLDSQLKVVALSTFFMSILFFLGKVI
ncbi:MAG: 1,4-dihydroxy-2-naphthoate octaprenyltransferase [Capnocytophaga sp.]|nr:1,4-dihydroxy-2-naphthoate octaprenyltransferase [Capnocytophaga sp.]